MSHVICACPGKGVANFNNFRKLSGVDALWYGVACDDVCVNLRAGVMHGRDTRLESKSVIAGRISGKASAASPASGHAFAQDPG